MTTSTAGPTLSSATVHCKTSTLKGNVVSEPGGWPILAWFQQSTYWCYNGKTVTSHKTTYRAGVTASGTLNKTAPGAIPVLISSQFSFTEGPAVDKKGNVFFTDQPNDKIWKYYINGKLSVFMEKGRTFQWIIF